MAQKEKQEQADKSSGTETPLALLRAELARRNLNGFIVPHADEYQNEYLPACAERLAWLTGFTGSAGLALVLESRAAVFADGRYTLQLAAETDSSCFTLLHLMDDPAPDWLATHAEKGVAVGYDPRLHTPDSLAKFEKACAKAGASLVACEDNPLDAVWRDQPLPPAAPTVPHDLAYAGKSSTEKRRELAAELKKRGVGAAVLTAPDSIAWLLNIRGGDVDHTPLPLCFAILHTDAPEKSEGPDAPVDLFLDPAKGSAALDAHLGPDVRRHAPDELAAALDRLAAAGGKILLDPAHSAAWFFDRINAASGGDNGNTAKGKIERAADPCQLPKACRNQVELDGARAAHLRDGASLVTFLAWLTRTAPGSGLGEMAAADKLESLRAGNDRFMDLSFPTISGSGPNGAIIHYRATPESNRILEPGDIYLLDSGAQYLDGTTDVTRTVFIGGTNDETPTPQQRDRFTRVLQGHMAIATACFPEGTRGGQLDALARAPLWRAGLDFDHGTGHGVGSYLGVHEGPQRIGKLGGSAVLAAGMILSNEPGYYKAGCYGIRIENLLAVTPAPKIEGAERAMLAFETLTLAPIDRALIEPDLLDALERAWLDAYHARVRDSLTPLVDGDTAAWLDAATEPI